MLISTNWALFPQVKIILIPDQEFLPSVVDYKNKNNNFYCPIEGPQGAKSLQ